MEETTEKAIYTIGVQVISFPVFLTNLIVVVSSCIILNTSRQDQRVATILLANIAFADMVMPLSILFGLFYPPERRTPLICALELATWTALVTMALTSFLNTDEEEIDEETNTMFFMLFGPLVIITNLAVVVASKLHLCYYRKPVIATIDLGRQISLTLLGNLALADVAFAIPISLHHLVPELHRTNIGCTIEKGAMVSCSLTSMCCIVLIAVDRYFFIVHSIRYDRYMTEQRARLLIHLSWLIGIIFGFTPITIKSISKTEQGPNCRYATPENIDVMLISGSIAAPLIVATFVLYMAIYRKAKEVSSTTTVQRSNCGPSSSNIHRSIGIQRLKTRSVIVVFLSSFCFLLTWGPYLVTLVIYGVMCGEDVNGDRRELCHTLESLMASPFPLLGFLNSLINPIIFAWWHRPFTRALFEIFCPSRARKMAQAKSVDVCTITSSI